MVLTMALPFYAYSKLGHIISIATDVDYEFFI